MVNKASLIISLYMLLLIVSFIVPHVLTIEQYTTTSLEMDNEYATANLLSLPLTRQARHTANKTLDRKINQLVTSFLEQIVRCRRVSGLSLAVVQGVNDLARGSSRPETVTRVFGTANIELKEPVNPNTVFCLAACTKAFTTSLMALLLREHG